MEQVWVLDLFFLSLPFWEFLRNILKDPSQTRVLPLYLLSMKFDNHLVIL